jgi:hypothetical protein
LVPVRYPASSFGCGGGFNLTLKPGPEIKFRAADECGIAADAGPPKEGNITYKVAGKISNNFRKNSQLPFRVGAAGWRSRRRGFRVRRSLVLTLPNGVFLLVVIKSSFSIL